MAYRPAMQKRSKYGAQKVHFNGEKFDSEREFKRWQTLRILQSIGEIRDLRRQVKIAMLGHRGPILTPSGRQAFYVADFVYFDAKTGVEVVEDAKGFPTPEYKLKRAILAAQGVTIKES